MSNQILSSPPVSTNKFPRADALRFQFPCSAQFYNYPQYREDPPCLRTGFARFPVSTPCNRGPSLDKFLATGKASLPNAPVPSGFLNRPFGAEFPSLGYILHREDPL